MGKMSPLLTSSLFNPSNGSRYYQFGPERGSHTLRCQRRELVKRCGLEGGVWKEWPRWERNRTKKRTKPSTDDSDQFEKGANTSFSWKGSFNLSRRTSSPMSKGSRVFSHPPSDPKSKRNRTVSGHRRDTPVSSVVHDSIRWNSYTYGVVDDTRSAQEEGYQRT